MKTLLKLAALLFVVSVLNSMLTTVLMMFWTAIYCWPKGN